METDTELKGQFNTPDDIVESHFLIFLTTEHIKSPFYTSVEIINMRLKSGKSAPLISFPVKSASPMKQSGNRG